MPDHVTPRLACTVLLLRDGDAGLEVFMVQRSHRVDFAEGAMVFPGGRVEDADADPRLRARARGADALDDAALQLHVAGIRETFEESGVMLAGPRGSDGLVDPSRLRALGDTYRTPLASDELGLVDVLEREDLELDCAALVPWARWITPDVLPKRFDTYFYAVAAPADQLPVHDGWESVASVWLTPRQGLDDVEAGARKMVFATLMNLERLELSADVAGALAAARAQPVVTILPAIERDPSGKARMRIPADAGYPRHEVAAEGLANP